VQRVDGKVAKERVEREVRNSLRCQSSHPSVDGGCFSTIVTVAAGVSTAAAVTTLSLPDMLW